MPDESPPELPELPDHPFGPPGPTPWEDPERSWLGRFFGTLVLAFRPLSALNRVGYGPVAPALRFALLTVPPLALASGVIPFTRSLTFGPNLQISAAPGGLPVELDLAQAAGLGLALALLQLLAFAVPFASLARAFAADAEGELRHAAEAAWRISLFRAWTLPGALLATFGLYWLLPAGQGALLGPVLLFGARLLLVLQYSAATRMVGGGPFAGLASTLIPLVLESLVSGVFMSELAPSVPDAPTQPAG